MPIGVKDTFTMSSPRSRNRTLPVPLKIKIVLYDPAIPLLGMYLKKGNTLIQKDT